MLTSTGTSPARIAPKIAAAYSGVSSSRSRTRPPRARPMRRSPLPTRAAVSHSSAYRRWRAPQTIAVLSPRPAARLSKRMRARVVSLGRSRNRSPRGRAHRAAPGRRSARGRGAAPKRLACARTAHELRRFLAQPLVASSCRFASCSRKRSARGRARILSAIRSYQYELGWRRRRASRRWAAAQLECVERAGHIVARLSDARSARSRRRMRAGCPSRSRSAPCAAHRRSARYFRAPVRVRKSGKLRHMRFVRDERMAAQVGREQPLAVGARSASSSARSSPPRSQVAASHSTMNVLIDRGVAVVVRDERAVARSSRNVSVRHSNGCAVPYQANLLVSHSMRGRNAAVERAPHDRIDAVRANHQIAAGQRRERCRASARTRGARRALALAAAGAAAARGARCREAVAVDVDALALWTIRWIGHDSMRRVSVACIAGASRARNSSAPCENTTPKPNVASRGFCSTMRTSASARRRFASSAKSRPAGPAPAMPMRIVDEGGETRGRQHFNARGDCQRNPMCGGLQRKKARSRRALRRDGKRCVSSPFPARARTPRACRAAPATPGHWRRAAARRPRARRLPRR